MSQFLIKHSSWIISFNPQTTTPMRFTDKETGQVPQVTKLISGQHEAQNQIIRGKKIK